MTPHPPFLRKRFDILSLLIFILSTLLKLHLSVAQFWPDTCFCFCFPPSTSLCQGKGESKQGFWCTAFIFMRVSLFSPMFEFCWAQLTPGWGVQVWATIFQVTDSHTFGKEVQKCKIRNVGNDHRPGSCRQHNIGASYCNIWYTGRPSFASAAAGGGVISEPDPNVRWDGRGEFGQAHLGRKQVRRDGEGVKGGKQSHGLLEVLISELVIWLLCPFWMWLSVFTASPMGNLNTSYLWPPVQNMEAEKLRIWICGLNVDFKRTGSLWGGAWKGRMRNGSGWTSVTDRQNILTCLTRPNAHQRLERPVYYIILWQYDMTLYNIIQHYTIQKYSKIFWHVSQRPNAHQRLERRLVYYI